MQRQTFTLTIFLIIITGLIFCSGKEESKDIPDDIVLPDGFKIEIYADDVKNARAMCWGDEGTLFVGSREEGKVYAVIDNNQDYKADEVKIIASDLNMPVGVAFKNGDLYTSSVSKIIKYEDIESHLDNPPAATIVNDDFPSEEHHGWKFIAFGPDGKLYVPVGAPCNICLEEDERYASIMRMNDDGTELEVYESGIRNSVGFDWHPVTKDLWFTDNGRDWLGDEIPPCELNHATEKGQHFGYPFCHGGFIPDPKFNDRGCSEFIKPAKNLLPHCAPLGMMFYTGSQFPAEYKNQILICEHGSWNRSTKIGYQVSLVKLDDQGDVTSYTSFANGWLKDGKVSGRPVDVLQMDDGSILVSDDYDDKIYRIYYEK